MGATLVLEAVFEPSTPENYRKVLNGLLAQAGTITGKSETAMIKVLDDARKEVLATLSDLALSDDTAALYRRSLGGIEEAIANLAQNMNTTLADYQAQGFFNGMETAIKPIAGAKGFEVITAAITQDQLQILSQFSASLVQDITSSLRTKINTAIAGVVTGTNTPAQAAAQIGKNLTSKNHFSTIAHRARAIVVTEVGRAHALGAQAAQTRLAQDIADAGGGWQVRKQWLNAHLPGARETHLDAEGRYGPDGDPGPIPVDQEYEIAGFKALYPRDPSLPPGESVHCHCVSLTVLVEGDPLEDEEPTPLDPNEGLTAGQKFGPAVKKDPNLSYVNADTGKPYAGKTPIYKTTSGLQTASGKPVIAVKKVHAPIDNPIDKAAAQTAYTTAKTKAAAGATAKTAPTTGPKLTPKLATIADDPYKAAGLVPEKPLANGTNGYGGQPMTKALGYTDPKASGFIWDGELGGWKHPKAPAGKQLPDFKDLTPFEQKSLLTSAGLKTKVHQNQVMKAIGLSDDAVDVAQAAKPPIIAKPNVTPTPPPPPPPKPVVKPKLTATQAKAQAKLTKVPDKKLKPSVRPGNKKYTNTAASERIQYEDLRKGHPSKTAWNLRDGDRPSASAWKRKVMEDLGAKLEQSIPEERLIEFANNGPVTLYGSLGQETLSQRITGGIVQGWAQTSGDSSTASLMMQRAAAEVFDLPWPPAGYSLPPRLLAEVDALHERWNDITTQVVRDMYENTQAEMKRLYPNQKTIKLVRGMDVSRAQDVLHLDDVELNPMSSFSINLDTSHSFGSTMMYVEVPLERIIGTPFSGYGCLSEFEYVVIGARAAEAATVVPTKISRGY